MAINPCLFNHDEKIFSITKTDGVVAGKDARTIWAELFGYLFVAGIFFEGDSGTVQSAEVPTLSQVGALGGYYDATLGNIYTKNIRLRAQALGRMALPEQDKALLDDLGGLFSFERKHLVGLTGKAFVSLSARYDFDEDFVTVAHYLGIMYGQRDFVAPKNIPLIYVSAFGNIHLSRNTRVSPVPGTMIYGSIVRDNIVTPLWALVASLIDCYVAYPAPGDALTYHLANLTLLRSLPGDRRYAPSRTIPSIASGWYVFSIRASGSGRSRMIERANAEFLFGDNLGGRPLRVDVFSSIIHLMKEKAGFAGKSDRTLFSEGVSLDDIVSKEGYRDSGSVRKNLLSFALESLGMEADAKVETSDEKTAGLDIGSPDDDDDDVPKDDVDGGATNSPATPPPAVPAQPVIAEKNNIGLISFDRTGEGSDDDMYRSAVVALNDRVQSDESDAISSEVKEALKQWVNGYLYRTAISETKKQMKALGLQVFFKSIQTKEG